MAQYNLVKLEPALAAMLAAGAAAPPEQLPIAGRRRRFAEELAAIDKAGPAMGAEHDVAIGALGGRLFRPTTLGGRQHAILFLHGGGWIQGSTATHASLCRFLAHHARRTVVSIDYRLAPEHVFPAPVEDALQSYDWLQQSAADLEIDPMRIALAGDSAGGNIAAGAAIELAFAANAPEALLLLYPAVDLLGDTPSRTAFAKGYWLDTLDELIATYVPDPARRRDPRASPARAPSFEGFPRTMIVTAGHDPLRDEAWQLALRLVASGVTCSIVNAGSMIHGFLSLHGLLPEAERQLVAIARTFDTFTN